MWNMFKINNKLTSCSSVSTVNFEHVIAGCVQYTDALISNDHVVLQLNCYYIENQWY